MSYNSKYTGAEVESLLDAANGKQDKITDLDAIRSGAAAGATALQNVPAEYITESELEQKGYLTAVPSEYVTETELTNKGYATTSALNDKVDKVTGKQLSTEDFTTALKTKLQGLSNYDDTAISDAVSSLQAQLNTLVSGNASSAIESFNEIIAFLDGVKDTQDLSSIIAGIEQQIAGKQATISDLDTIRAGAAKGATALQSYTEKYTGTITGIKMNGASKGTSGVVDLGTVITSHQDISGKADKSSLASVATSGSYNDLSNKPTIPAEQVNADWNATSGKAQILNKPTIPSAVTESTVSGWGFTKNTGTYSKPSGGIPKTDLASAVQTSLGKADTALQSHQDISGKQDQLVSGTNIKTINGQSLVGSGDITIGTEEIYEVDVPYYEGGNILGITTEVWNKLLVTPTISVKLSNTAFKITLNKTDLGLDNLLIYAGPSVSLSAGVPLVVTVIFSGDGENFVGIPPYSCTSTYFSVPVSTSQLENDSNFVSSNNLKTINGESLVGEGDITISGGGGEDIRFFTDFTVEDFIDGVKNYDTISVNTSQLLEATRKNKVICIPFRQYDKGYKIAYYKLYDESGEVDLSLHLEYLGVRYDAYMEGTDLYGVDSVTYMTKYELFKTDGRDVFLEIYDNTIYDIYKTIDSLTIVPSGSLNIAATIVFSPSDDFSLEIYETVYWANGVAPQFEKDVAYELSLSKSDRGLNAVLTPFKPVE